MTVPLMILSDAPSSQSGLGRITRELCQHISRDLSDTFRLATLGYGGVGAREFPWQQYTMCGDPPSRGWFVPELYMAWNNFAGEEKGILLTIWDASRMNWLVDPGACPEPVIGEWLRRRPFSLWGYWPVDAEGPNHKLPHGFPRVMKAYDRNIAYSEWARGLMKNDGIEAEALPHGIDTSVWYPRDRGKSRGKFKKLGFSQFSEKSLLVGVVATNQQRKDWGLAFETCAELMKQGKDVYMWCHIDTVSRHWDIAALAQDFGMIGRVIVSSPPMLDEDLAGMYSGCDVTLGIGCFEGFGYPVFESLACGTPCIHGNGGGAAEHLKPSLLVDPYEMHTNGPFNCLRPSFSLEHWVLRVLEQTEPYRIWNGVPEQLDWNNLWPHWKEWLLKGLNERRSSAVHPATHRNAATVSER